MNQLIEKALPPVLNKADFETEEEYQYYLDSEASEHEPQILSGQARKELTEIARNTIKSIAGESTDKHSVA